MSELKAEQWLDYAGEPMPCYPKSEADKVIAEKNAKIRRLRRALYKACAMWADRTRLICSVFGSDAPKIRWERMYDKCRAKAEEYK